MRLVLYQGTISGVDGPSGFLCHCRSNNNPHWNLFFYVCYVLASLCLTPPCLWNSVFRPFIQRFHYGTCQLLLILKVVWLQMQPEIKKKKNVSLYQSGRRDLWRNELNQSTWLELPEGLPYVGFGDGIRWSSGMSCRLANLSQKVFLCKIQ